MTELIAAGEGIEQASAAPVARFDPVRVGLLVLALALALVAGYRLLGEGADYDSYFQYYLTVTGYYSSNVSRFEVGFQYWSWIAANKLNLAFPVFYTITVFIALSVKFDLIRKYTYAPWFAILTYAVLFYPAHEYTQIRVALALALAYFGIFKLYERKYVQAVVAFVLAVAFHASAAIVILIAVGAMFIPLPLIMRDATISDRFVRCGRGGGGLIRVYNVAGLTLDGSQFLDCGSEAEPSFAVVLAQGKSERVSLQGVRVASLRGRGSAAVTVEPGHRLDRSSNVMRGNDFGGFPSVAISGR